MAKKNLLTLFSVVFLLHLAKAKPIPVLIKTSSADVTAPYLRKLNIPIQSKAGNIWSVYVERNQVPLLNQTGGIISVQLPITGMSPKSDDSTRKLVRVKQVHEGLGLPKPYTGSGVVVGIIDGGFDYTHPSFRTPSGALRIARVWEQQQNGQAPTSFNYGNELSGSAAMLSRQKDQTSSTHGTFVAGVAAGSPVGTNIGIAPEADLVLVSLNYGKDDYYSDYEIAPASILDGIKYIFDYAKSQQKPAVVNISWGHHCGPHDGTTLLDQGITNLTDSGYMVVIAAGNEGSIPLHLANYFTQEDTIFTRQTFPSWVYTTLGQNKEHEHGMVDFWGSRNREFSVQWQWVDNDMKVVARTPFYNTVENRTIDTLLVLGNDTLSYKIEAEKSNVNNSKPHLLFRYRNNAYNSYQLIVAIRSKDAIIDAWNCGGDWKYSYGMFLPTYRNNTPIRKGAQGNTMVTIGESGGNCTSVITVGAYNANLDWFTSTGNLLDLRDVNNQEGAKAMFSSIGPNANGNLKPDLVAPGRYLVGPINKYSTEQPASYMVTSTVTYESSSYTYAMGEGTSFAAPVVCGAVALLLQINPKLTVKEVKQLLSSTAITDAFTNAIGGTPNTSFGAGKLNILSAVTKLLKVTGVNNPVTIQPITYPNPFNDEFHIHAQAPINSIEIFDMQGKSVFTQSYSTPQQDVTLKTADLPEGFYMAQVKSGNELFVLKLSCIH